ncbi:MAG: hypothetical protein OXS47_02160 [Chloroflexota bacterium]|nr:hypothetical protein [Chloroflexota bacterium]
MPTIYGRDWDTALDGFDDAALCVLPGVPHPPEPFLFGVEALHAVLVAAVLHPEWAVAWYRGLAAEEEESGLDYECEHLAADFAKATPESDLRRAATLSTGSHSDPCETFRVAAERVLPTSGDGCETGACFSKALHAVLIAAVRNPQWARTWFETVFATEGPDSETHNWAAEFVEVSRVSWRGG